MNENISKNLADELQKANYLNKILLDAIPHPALLVRKDRTVIAANKIAREEGAKIGGFCWRDWGSCLYLNTKEKERINIYKPGIDKPICCNFCKGDDALEINEPVKIQTKVGEAYQDIFWIPTQEKGVYLHYCIDITEQKKREEEIRYLSFHDMLTGLYNRAYFEEELNRVDNTGRFPLSIIIGDINGLKLANDVFGHHAGDKLLQQMAEILKDSCRVGDIIARYGGDEFAIILPEATHRAAVQVCERISEVCAKTPGELIQPSIALGCATKECINQDIQKVIKDAEDRMYRHKLLESKSLRNFVISSLEKTLHEKDYETLDHAQRLIDTTIRVGKEIGLLENELDDLNLLARLHDIGKIAISSHILNKPGKLTESELIEIRKHSEVGFRIAESSKNLTKIGEYILAHHEQWDGLGYPQGLRGEQIPLLSRILAIADAYDAMINDRPYRKAMTKEFAIEELKKCSGIQFDPGLVPVFIKIIND